MELHRCDTLVEVAEQTGRRLRGRQRRDGRQAVAAALHRYGFGTPALPRALRSASDALTLVSQAVIHPYLDGKTQEMHLHQLPWPREVLQDLGDQDVTLRVTLSYFVEPN